MTNIIDLSKFQKTKVNQEDGNLIDDPDYDLGSGWMVLDFRTQLHFLRNVQANVMQSQFVEQATQAVEVGSLLSIAEVLLGDIHPFFGFQKVTIQNNSHSEQDMVVSLRQYDTGEVKGSLSKSIFPDPIYDLQISIVEFEDDRVIPKSNCFDVSKISYEKAEHYHFRMAGVIKSLLSNIANFAFANEGFSVINEDNNVFVAYVQHSEKRLLQIALQTNPNLVYKKD